MKAKIIIDRLRELQKQAEVLSYSVEDIGQKQKAARLNNEIINLMVDIGIDHVKGK